MTINETKVCPVDKETLPVDAAFRGHVEVIIQDIII